MMVTMLYTAWGGFKTSLITDTIQATLFILLVIICTIAIGVTVEIDTSMIQQRSELLRGSQLGWQLLYILPVAIVFNNYFLSSYWQRCYAAKTQKDLTIGCTLAAILIFCLTFLVGFSGLIAAWADVYPGPDNVNEESSSTVLFLLINKYCPPWISALMLVLSVALSCAAYDTLQTALVATVSNDVFRNKINIWWIRLILVVNAAVIAPVATNKVNDVLILYLIADLVSAAVMPAMLLGFTDKLYFLNGWDVTIGGLGVFLFGLVYYDGDAKSAAALLIINEGLYPSENSFECLGTFIAAPVGSILWTIAAFGVRVLYTYIRSRTTGSPFTVFEKTKPLDPYVVAGNEQMLRPSLGEREAEKARMSEAGTLKKVLDAVRDLISDANWECNEDGISLQAMDNSHVALVTVHLSQDAFEPYRCDRNMPLGINLGSLTKVIKCAKDNDLVTLKADDSGESLGLTFESSNTDRIGEYSIKLLDIDQEHLGIPVTQYDSVISMPSSEFQRICRDLSQLGESIRIDASKEGIRFSVEGDVGKASVLLKQSSGASIEREEESEEEEEEEEEEEDVKPNVDEDEEEGDVKPKDKKRKSSKGGNKTKKVKKAKKDVVEDGVSISLQQQVSLTFSLKYLNNFTRSTPLSNRVTLSLSKDIPLLLEYEFAAGHIKYFLAPKIGDEDAEPSPGQPRQSAPSFKAASEPELIPGSEKLTVFIGSISAGVSDEWLERLLNAAGNLVTLKRVRGPTGKPQAFGFATFAEPDSVLRAIKTLNGISVPPGERGQPRKNLLVKADEKTRAFLDDYEKTLLKTDDEEMEEHRAEELIAKILDHMSDPTLHAKGPNLTGSVPIADDTPAHLRDLPPEEIPEEHRQETLNMIEMFRSGAMVNPAVKSKQIQRLEREQRDRERLEREQVERERERDQQTHMRKWGSRSSFGGNDPQSYNKPMGFVRSSSGQQQPEPESMPVTFEQAMNLVEQDERAENDRLARRLRDRELAFRDRERKFEGKERARLNEYDRDLARERANDSSDTSARESALHKLLAVDDDKLAEKGELFYDNRRRWRNARSQARRKEEAADEADRVAEINESEKVKRDTEAFLQQQAIEMENFAKEQKKKGVLMDDSMPIKLSAAAAQHPKPTSEQVESSKPVLHKSAFNDEEVDENGMPMQKRKLVKLDYSGIVPDQDELTPEQREAARRVRLREIANGVSLDYVQLSKIDINWDAITDVVISKKLIPIAESLMKEYFGEADEEMLEVTLLNENPSILDHVNQSFEYDYDAITLPFTKSSWKDRWQRYCVANEEDVKKGRARASYIAGQSENVVQDRQIAKEAEIWRLTRVYERKEVNVSKLDECESIIAFASDWLELDSPDEGIRFDSEIALKQEVAYASYLSIHTLILPPPRNRKFISDYARSVMAALDSSTYLQISVMIPVSDPTERASEDKIDPSSTWEVWDGIRTLCDYSPRLGVALDLTQPLPPPSAIKRWASEPTRQIIIPANVFVGNAKGYPVLSKPCQEFIKDQIKTLPMIILTHTYDKIHSSGGSKAYVQYLRFMEKLSNDRATSVEQFASGYMDWLQAPLQPLLDNLDSTTYEIFEKDPVKYQKYEQATYLALLDKEPNSLTRIAVVGAGRGPLVQGAINAVDAAGDGRKIHIMAIEKNPNACVTLQSRLDEWNDSKSATVELVYGDMRIIELEDERKNDILISELLGSFGDNELSPECLDGAMRLLKPYGVSIPSYYTSYIAPLSSSKLYNEVMHMGEAKSAEMPYVVMFQAVNILSGMNEEAELKPIQQYSTEWQEKSIEYKHLKKLLTDVVEELNTIGLNKAKLLDLLLSRSEDTHIEYVLNGPLNQPQPQLIVQFNDDNSKREWLSLFNLQNNSSGLSEVSASTSNKDMEKQQSDAVEEIYTEGTDPNNKEIHINLNADAKFLGALTAAFDKLEALQLVEKKKFAKQVETLCNAITGVTGPGAVSHSAFSLHRKKTNDLYAWREIFTLWVESAIYEGITESNRGERDVESAEKRLNAFAAEVVKRGLGDSRTMKSKQSRDALDQFLELNMALLDIKKFYTANLEAARKILKKHMKMTALPTDAFYSFAGVEGSALQTATSSQNSNFGWTFYTISLPRVLLSRLTETLIPIIPSIDDYNCLICQEIAFKPIRLRQVIVRIRSADGTFRFDLKADDTIELLKDNIVDKAPSLDKDTLALSNEPRGGETLLSSLSGRKLSDLGIKHGDLLFASSAKKDEETVEQSQPQIQQTSNIPARPWQLARDHAIDQYWSKQSGRIPRPTSSSKEGNLNTLPIEPYDKEYQAQNNIKHLSFHAYLRKLKDNNPPTSSVAQLPPLEELDYKYKQWVPNAITLQVQEYRMVDHVEFASSGLVEGLLNFWRASGLQRFGILLGKYAPYDAVPMGIKAVVESVHEIPQEGEVDGLTLGLPWEDQERIVDLAKSAGLEVLGMIYSDLSQPPEAQSPLCKRHKDSFFLSSLELCFSGHMQNAHKLSSTQSKSGQFNSRFITCVLSGTAEGGIDISAYQISDQGMALVDADIIEPSVEPSTLRLKESKPGKYIPDVFYRFKNEYNIEVKKNARPCFPVEYLLVNVTHGFPNQSNPTFKRNNFPIENRQGYQDQSVNKMVGLFLPVVSDSKGLGFDNSEDLDLGATSIEKKETLYDTLNDWHLCAFLEPSGMFSRDEAKLALRIGINREEKDLNNFIRSPSWLNLMAIAREQASAQAASSNAQFDAEDIPHDVLAASEQTARQEREQREQEQRDVDVSPEDREAIENLCAFGGFDFEQAKQCYLACEKNTEMAANLLFESM
ncbi:NPL4-domain-containing protein [Wallemia mellicola]|nr:NPL4-domain-containing protein [Wallemia mellicola]